VTAAERAGTDGLRELAAQSSSPWLRTAVLAVAAGDQGDSEPRRAELFIVRRALAAVYEYAGVPVPAGIRTDPKPVNP
jgi:hypothetical protein